MYDTMSYDRTRHESRVDEDAAAQEAPESSETSRTSVTSETSGLCTHIHVKYCRHCQIIFQSPEGFYEVV